MVKVSVCIQTYNHASFIAQAVDSVLVQETDFNYEIVLGEDESQDGTREICIEYARKYPDRIRLFLRSRKDVIYIDGRPTGRFNFSETLKAARGEYIARLDGDDYWTDPFKLQKQVDFLEARSECAICFHGVGILHEGLETEPTLPHPNNKRLFYGLEDILNRNFIYTCSLLYRSSSIPSLPEWYFNLMLGDWPLTVLAAENGQIGHLEDTMAVYRVHSAGIWSGAKSLQVQYDLLKMHECFRQHFGQQHRKLITSHISWCHLQIAASLADHGEHAGARNHLLNCIREYPKNPLIRWIDLGTMLTRLYAPALYTVGKSSNCINWLNAKRIAQEQATQSE